MTYAEMFKYLQQLHTQNAGKVVSEEKLDTFIGLVSQLPCTADGHVPEQPPGMEFPFNLLSPTPDAVDVRALDSGQKIPGVGCIHCQWLALLKWVKAKRAAST